jgi:immunity protein Imm1 of predicted polymorphic toxin system
MSSLHDRPERIVVTAVLTTKSSRVARGYELCVALVDEVLTLDHVVQETIMWVGDEQFHCTKNGPYPNCQMRVSVRPPAHCAALSYTDHDDPSISIANSHNPAVDLPEIDLIFNGDMGSVFPRSAVIPISEARNALLEWLRTRSLPTCIEWRPFDRY